MSDICAFYIAGPLHRKSEVMSLQNQVIKVTQKLVDTKRIFTPEFFNYECNTVGVKTILHTYKLFYFNNKPLTYNGKHVYLYSKENPEKNKTLQKIIHKKKHERIKIQAREIGVEWNS